MIDHSAARSLVLGQLGRMQVASPDDGWVILDDHTIERHWGWVFFYDSRKYRETGGVQFAVAGNAPFFVRRENGAVFVAGTAYPLEVYIDDFERGGCLNNRCIGSPT